MMKVHIHSLHSLLWNDTGSLPQDFPLDAYSRYKYGSATDAHALVSELFSSTVDAYTQWLQLPDIHITASAYKAVPTAAEQICHHFCNALNSWLYMQQLPEAIRFSIQRDTVFSGDYGLLEQAERQILMQQNILSCSTYLQHKRVIVIDDVCITGSHRHRVEQLLESCGVSEVLFLFLGQSQHKPLSGNVEHYMNHYWMKSLAQLDSIVQNEAWQVNARVCKYLLSYPDIQVLLDFWQKLPARIQLQIHDAMVADGYATMPEYSEVYTLLSAHVYHKDTNVRLTHA